nr:transcription initiation factor IIB-like [Malus domestica]
MEFEFCVDCKESREVVIDHQSGDTVCTDCGLVLGDHSMSPPSGEKRKQNKKEDNVDGIAPPSNQLNNAVSNPQKSLAKATKYLESMACWLDKHGLPDEVLHDAEVLYKKAVDKKIRSGRKFCRGRKFEVMVAACLFLACQESNNSRTPKEIAKAANGPSRKEINKMVKVLEKELEIRVRV